MIYHLFTLVVASGLIVLARLCAGGVKTPTVVVTAWWVIWGWIAISGLTGLFTFGWRTIMALLLALVAVLAGTVLARIHGARGPVESGAEERFRDLLRWTVFGAGSFALVWNIYLIPRALPLIATYGSNYRGAVFGAEAEAVFGSGWLAKGYSLLATPSAYLCAFSAIVLSLSSKRISYAIFGFVVMLTSDLVRLGRGGTYAMLVVGGVTWILSRRGPYQQTKKRVFSSQAYYLAGILVLGAIASAILGRVSSFRTTSATGTSPGVLSSVLNYHTAGFGLLNTELSGEPPPAASAIGYGRLTFGGIEQIMSLGIRRLNPAHQVYVSALDEAWRQEPRVIGTGSGGEMMMANAFYTVIFSLYHDGRWFFLAVFPAIYGFVITRRYTLYRMSGSLVHLAWCVAWIFCGLFSIFLSPVEGTTFWLVLGGFALLSWAARRGVPVERKPRR